MSVTQTRYDDNLSVEPSRMLQTSDRAWIQIGGERPTHELMSHALGTHVKNNTGGASKVTWCSLAPGDRELDAPTLRPIQSARK